MNKKKDWEGFIGKRFGSLVVMGISEPYINPSDGKPKTRLLVRCDCGTEFIVKGSVLIHGRKERCTRCNISLGAMKKTKHGLIRHPLYCVYGNMKDRCYNPHNIGYQYYGGRGITVCDNWLNDFRSFYDWCISHGYKDGLQIDRIDNNLGYSPSNCRFVTCRQNTNNRRCTRTIDGVPASVWFESADKHPTVDYDLFRSRYFELHWALERSLLTPRGEPIGKGNR